MPSISDSYPNDSAQERSSEPPLSVPADSKSARTHSKSRSTSQQPTKVHKRRSIGNWDLIKTVGAGSMGQVKLARNRLTNDFVLSKLCLALLSNIVAANSKRLPPEMLRTITAIKNLTNQKIFVLSEKLPSASF